MIGEQYPTGERQREIIHVNSINPNKVSPKSSGKGEVMERMWNRGQDGDKDLHGGADDHQSRGSRRENSS